MAHASAVNTHHLRVWPIIIIISHPRASAPPLAEDERGGLPSRLLPRLLGVEQLGAAARRQVAGHAFIPLVVAAAVEGYDHMLGRNLLLRWRWATPLRLRASAGWLQLLLSLRVAGGWRRRRRRWHWHWWQLGRFILEPPQHRHPV